MKTRLVLKALASDDDFLERRNHGAFQHIPKARHRMRMATAVCTRRLGDEEQARLAGGHTFDRGGLQQFARNLRAHRGLLALHCIADRDYVYRQSPSVW